MLAAASGCSRWISGEPSRRFAHRLRMRHGAVLVGAGTVRRDDPRLTIRLPGVCAPRVRAVLAPRLDLDPRARLFERSDGQPRPTIYTVRGLPDALVARFDGLAEVVAVPDRSGVLSLDDVLADLARREVQSVLVEGGAKTHAGFLDAGLADRMTLFLSRRLLGSRGGTPLLDREVVERPALGWRLGDVRQLALGDDLVLLGKLEAPAEART
jgi:diaminohydroxyphosphoribosylaminopyrimidine deaminase/5-amino-6-(5-phosphoribosylamino)uracil reductase